MYVFNRAIKYRNKKNLTIDQLADKAGLSVTSINKVMQVKGFSDCSLSTLDKIAQALEIPLSQLIRDAMEE